MKRIELDMPPHIDHWTTMLVWVLAEVGFKQTDLYDTASREIIRCHPLYQRFVAANAVTETELSSMLVNSAQATVKARETLKKLPVCQVHVICTDPGLRINFDRYALPFMPDHFEVTLGSPRPPEP